MPNADDRLIEAALSAALLNYRGVSLTDAAAGTLQFLERLLKSILSEADPDALVENKAVIVSALDKLQTEIILFDPESIGDELDDV